VAETNLAKCYFRHCSTELPTHILYIRWLQFNKKIIRFKLALLLSNILYNCAACYPSTIRGYLVVLVRVYTHYTSHSVRRNLHHTQLINMRDTIILKFTADCHKYICRYTLADIYCIIILL